MSLKLIGEPHKKLEQKGSPSRGQCSGKALGGYSEYYGSNLSWDMLIVGGRLLGA